MGFTGIFERVFVEPLLESLLGAILAAPAFFCDDDVRDGVFWADDFFVDVAAKTNPAQRDVRVRRRAGNRRKRKLLV